MMNRRQYLGLLLAGATLMTGCRSLQAEAEPNPPSGLSPTGVSSAHPTVPRPTPTITPLAPSPTATALSPTATI
ncbi:MAG TPA: hypothetical protein VFZ25_16765, partial [Chloroflexota bacterium]|nr:hypothetical protein [Chloroflexota bacterium]